MKELSGIFEELLDVGPILGRECTSKREPNSFYTLLKALVSCMDASPIWHTLCYRRPSRHILGFFNPLGTNPHLFWA